MLIITLICSRIKDSLSLALPHSSRIFFLVLYQLRTSCLIIKATKYQSSNLEANHFSRTIWVLSSKKCHKIYFYRQYSKIKQQRAILQNIQVNLVVFLISILQLKVSLLIARFLMTIRNSNKERKDKKRYEAACNKDIDLKL